MAEVKTGVKESKIKVAFGKVKAGVKKHWKKVALVGGAFAAGAAVMALGNKAPVFQDLDTDEPDDYTEIDESDDEVEDEI